MKINIVFNWPKVYRGLQMQSTIVIKNARK